MKNFFFIVALLLLASCQGFDLKRSSEKVDIVGEADGHGMIVLGDKLEDPIFRGECHQGLDEPLCQQGGQGPC